METAKQFWKSQNTYPEYGNIKRRRWYELEYLVPLLKNTNSVLSLGCGDCALITCLKQLTDIKRFHAYDLTASMFPPGIHEWADAQTYDCSHATLLPQVDFTIWAGVIPFLEDNEIENTLKEMQTKMLYLRAPCANEPTRINTYSEKLKAKYEAYYRTVEQVKELLKDWNIEDVRRAYPDEVESEFGTKQFIFLCSKK